MLYLVRNLTDDGITIIAPTGERLKFYVTKVSGKQVTLGFENFDKFKVLRSELLEEKDADKLRY